MNKEIQKIFNDYKSDELFEGNFRYIKSWEFFDRWSKLDISLNNHVISQNENVVPCSRKRDFDISEGLIETYPSRSVLRIIKKFLIEKCHLAKSEINLGISDWNDDKTQGIISIGAVDVKWYDRMLDSIKKIMKTYVGSFQRDEKMMFETHKFFYFSFEPKFPKNYSVSVIGKYLYHVSPERYKGKILKHGIKPKETKIIDEVVIPERNYFFTEYNFESINDLLGKKNASEISRNWIVYQIEIDKVPSWINFYKDLDMPFEDAVFSYETIPSNAISNSILIDITTGDIIK